MLTTFLRQPPGFTWDEAPAELGTGLRLPPWLESNRERIERVLPSVTVPRIHEESHA